MKIILDSRNRLYRLIQDGKEVDFSSSASVLRKKYGRDIPLVLNEKEGGKYEI